ncbi:MAG TPA: hypothetical protein VGD58_09025 [Herpetosiphonaceae bacterium]
MSVTENAADAAQMRSSFPIAFQLCNESGDEVLPIADDSSGQRVQLVIGNTARDTIQLQLKSDPQNNKANTKLYHFALIFRKGTLASSAISGALPEDPASWDGAWVEGVDTVTLYLLGLKETSIRPDTPLVIWLQDLSASSSQGTRVARVDLQYTNLVFHDDPRPEQPTVITGSRRSRITLLNQRGREHVPLHSGFATPGYVFNDGTSNSLTLRITNISPVPLPLSTDVSAPTKLLLAFEVAPEGQSVRDVDLANPAHTPWALADQDTVSKVTLTVAASDGGTWHAPGTPQLGEQAVWEVVYQGTQSFLAPGHSLHLTLSNIVTTLPPGYTNLYLRYQNIPHYWDGQFVYPIERRRRPQNFGRYLLGSPVLGAAGPFSAPIRTGGGKILLLISGTALIQGGGVAPVGPGGTFGGATTTQPENILVSLGSALSATIEIPASARATRTPFLGKLEFSGLQEGEQTLTLLKGPSVGLSINPPSIAIQHLDVIVLQLPS